MFILFIYDILREGGFIIKRFVIVLSAIAAAAAALTVYSVHCNNTLITREYTVTSDKPSPKLRIVFISDQHNRQFGENDSVLLEKIKALEPDLIFSGGDMMTRDVYTDEVMKNLFSGLSKIAPTYCILGNHERDMAASFVFSSEIGPTGAILLDDKIVELNKDGVDYIIGGMSDFPYYEYMAPDYNTPSRYLWEDFLMRSKDKFSILLHHQPEYIADMLDGSGIDLVLCGHTHGGQVRLPFFGGVYSPNQGLFPKYDLGEYDFGSTKMIVSAGLGNPTFIPRLNNCPEITVINIE